MLVVTATVRVIYGIHSHTTCTYDEISLVSEA